MQSTLTQAKPSVTPQSAAPESKSGRLAASDWLYAPCRWFRDVKGAHPASCLKYL
jgi:hypothetical protein